MLLGSAGRATGRVEGPEGAVTGLGVAAGLGLAAALAAGRLLTADRLAEDLGFELLEPAPVERFAAERFPSSFPARVDVDDRLVVLRFGAADLDLGLLAARFASVFPARLAVMRFDEEVDFLAVERFAVDFLVADFFFAGISPPSDGDVNSPVASARILLIRLFSCVL
ncbi:MAG TPA: hypothetical protein VGD57_03925 [Candidatus Dormibacteraeota bacterium]|jgi:hypothetical protein